MKKYFVLVSCVLAFATTGMFAQTATEPTPAPATSAKSGVAKHGKKHAKHGHKKHKRKTK